MIHKLRNQSKNMKSFNTSSCLHVALGCKQSLLYKAVITMVPTFPFSHTSVISCNEKRRHSLEMKYWYLYKLDPTNIVYSWICRKEFIIPCVSLPVANQCYVCLSLTLNLNLTSLSKITCIVDQLSAYPRSLRSKSAFTNPDTTL